MGRRQVRVAHQLCRPQGAVTMSMMMRKKGLTLVEMLVAVIIASIGLAAVAVLGYQSYTHFRTTTEVSQLQQDLDIAAFTIKGYIDEAKKCEALGGSALVAYNNPFWQVEFYREGANLVLKWTDKRVNPWVVTTRTVIRTLKDADDALTISDDDDHPDIKWVTIRVTDGTLEKAITFSVKMRNFYNL